MIKYYIKGQRKELDNEFILQFQILQIISEIMKNFTTNDDDYNIYYKIELDFIINSCPAALYSVKIKKDGVNKLAYTINYSCMDIYLTTVPNNLDIYILNYWNDNQNRLNDRQILLNYNDPKFLDILHHELKNL